MFNPAIANLTAPPVAIVQNWIDDYSGHCGELIDLSQAVPDHPAHADLLLALGRCAADTKSLGYGAIEGEDALRTAYASHLMALYDAPVGMEETLITSGCNQAFITAAMTVAGAGDDVLMMRPAYFNHDSTLAMMGINTRFVDTYADAGFIPDPAAIDKAITPKTRAVALVSPNNPTGAIYQPDVLDEIAKLCLDHDIWLILDETYRDFLPIGQRPHSLLSGPARHRVIMLYSFSKAYAIPGHRLGAVMAPTKAITQMAKIMDNIQICAPRAAQRALAPMIEKLASWRADNAERMAHRALAFQAAIDKSTGWNITSMGAYFGYVRHPGKMDSMAMAGDLVRKAGVLTIPGGFFGNGQDQFLRFAFANADVTAIEQLPERLALSG